jgi:light-regulated signal transduction histidine kinase (bacteriophytochrome)
MTDIHKQLHDVRLELQASEDRFRSLVSKSPNGILIVDASAQVCFVNPAAESLFGRTAEQLLGIMFGFPVVVGETTELDIPRKNGTLTVVEMRVVETSWEGQPASLASLGDITERKQKEQERQELLDELQRSNKDLEQFAQVLSHDLQEPLRTVRTSCESLMKSLDGQLDDQDQVKLRFAVEGAQRMQTQINGLLEFARVGTQDESFETTDLNEVVKDAIANLSAAISESGATLSKDEFPTVPADRSQLLQVFQNLIGNAIKFRGDAPPEIRIAAQHIGHEWQFGISDNGIGINPQQADRVFMIFQRLHTQSEYPGTGLGLAICKKIIERHGGRVWIESEPGNGSTFHFTIPDRAPAG